MELVLTWYILGMYGFLFGNIESRPENKHDLLCLPKYLVIFDHKLEFRESDVLPGKTKVKQGKFIEFIP